MSFYMLFNENVYIKGPIMCKIVFLYPVTILSRNS